MMFFVFYSISRYLSFVNYREKCVIPLNFTFNVLQISFWRDFNFTNFFKLRKLSLAKIGNKVLNVWPGPILDIRQCFFPGQ